MEFCAGRSRKPFDNGPISRATAVAPGAYVGRAIRAATLEHEEERGLREAVAWLGLGAREMRDLLEDPVFSVRSRVDFSSLPELQTGTDEGSRRTAWRAGYAKGDSTPSTWTSPRPAKR
jgi:hypothetical protein